MTTFRLSRRAEDDLTDIGIHTLNQRGERQTVRYIDNLESCCQKIADNPAARRPCDYIRPGLRRMEQGSHVIFFRRTGKDIVVIRILHKKMLPEANESDETT